MSCGPVTAVFLLGNKYLILYRILDEYVEIMHVLHGKRDLDGLFQ